MPRYAELADAAWLRQQYESERRSQREIADALGCSDVAVTLALRRAGIPTRSAMENRVMRGSKRSRQFKQLDDSDWLRDRVSAGLSAAMIAEEVGCSPAAVSKALTTHGIAPAQRRRRGQLSGETAFRLRDATWLTRRYIDERASIQEIAAELGCAMKTVSDHMARFGIQPRDRWEARTERGTRRQFSRLDDHEWLSEQYVTLGRSTDDIARELGCSQPNVMRAVQRAGLPTHAPGRKTGYRNPDAIPQLRDADWLREQRVTRGRSAAEIAEELGCTKWTVVTWLKRHGIRVRNTLKSTTRATYRTSGGYVYVWLPDHPAASHRGFVLEHRLVAETALGRPLAPQEVVHHINFAPGDNRPENLMVFPTNGAHISFEANPPAWVPRCSCCGKPHPESLTGRPTHVPMLYDPA